MSSRPASGPTTRTTPSWPTAAFLRAVLLSVTGLLIGVVAHRVDVLVAVTPFIVWLAWSVLTRDRLDGVRAQLLPPSQQLLEGEAVDLHLNLPDDVHAGMVVDPPPLVLLNPPRGVVVGAGSDNSCIRAEPTVWGRHLLGPARVALEDQSGAWRRIDESNQVFLQVRPRASSLVGGSGVSRPIGVAGVHRSSRRGPGTDLAEVREFVPGDRLRRINWAVSSRTGHLNVTDTFVERDTDVLVVVDSLAVIDGMPQPDGTAGASSLDSAVRAMAGLTQHYARFGDRIGVHDLGRRTGNVPAGTGARQVQTLVARMALVRRDLPTEIDVVPVQRLASGALVFVCSPLLNDNVAGEILRLRRLGGEVVVVDTLPEGLGRQALPGRDHERLTEGWTLRRFEHDRTVELLLGAGIPVTAWRGPASLATVLVAMEAARSAPRLGVGR